MSVWFRHCEEGALPDEAISPFWQGIASRRLQWRTRGTFVFQTSVTGFSLGLQNLREAPCKGPDFAPKSGDFDSVKAKVLPKIARTGNKVKLTIQIGWASESWGFCGKTFKHKAHNPQGASRRLQRGKERKIKNSPTFVYLVSFVFNGFPKNWRTPHTNLASVGTPCASLSLTNLRGGVKSKQSYRQIKRHHKEAQDARN